MVLGSDGSPLARRRRLLRWLAALCAFLALLIGRGDCDWGERFPPSLRPFFSLARFLDFFSSLSFFCGFDGGGVARASLPPSLLPSSLPFLLLACGMW